MASLVLKKKRTIGEAFKVKELKVYNHQDKISPQILSINPFEFLIFPLFPLWDYVKGIYARSEGCNFHSLGLVLNYLIFPLTFPPQSH